MLYSGWDGKGEFFYSMEILYGGIPGRPIGDGMDGHSWWPLFENIPTEYLEAYYPLRIDGYTTVTDSGGAGLHRGGNGVEKRYVYLEPGEVSIHDDRWLTRPWGVLGGEPGRALGEDPAPRRRDRGAAAVEVRPGRRSSRATCSSTARRAAAAGRTGSTGPSRSSPATSRSGSSRARRRARGYGVVLARRRHGRRRRDRGGARAAARGARRGARRSTSARRSRRCSPTARRRPASSRPTPAKPLRWSPLEDGARRSPASAQGTAIPSRGSRELEGFHGRGGFGRRPALLVVDVNVGFTDPASPLVCDLDGRGRRDPAAARGGAASRDSGRLHDGLVRRGRQGRTATAFIDKVPGAAHARGGQPLGRDRPADRAACRTSPC